MLCLKHRSILINSNDAELSHQLHELHLPSLALYCLLSTCAMKTLGLCRTVELFRSVVLSKDRSHREHRIEASVDSVI
jgi:hypothetical protein